MNRDLTIFAAVIAAVLLIVIVAANSREPRSLLTEKDLNTDTQAGLVCRQQVRDRLKSPTSAEFSEGTFSQDAAGARVMTGTVDAQNTFGATVRSRFTCSVTWMPPNNWTVNDLQLQ